jgi:hypothetical protein
MDAFEWIELVGIIAIVVMLWETRSCLGDIEKQLQEMSARPSSIKPGV